MLSNVLRAFLFLASVWIALWILRKIRKAKAKVEDSLFWILFACMLIVLSLFPQIAYWLSGLLGVQSPVNFVFLAVLFAMILKIFRLSIRVSQLESKQQELVQRYAIDQLTKTKGNGVENHGESVRHGKDQRDCSDVPGGSVSSDVHPIYPGSDLSQS